MGTVIVVQSMSLDGFATAANVRAEQPMGDDGQRLVEWAFGTDPRDRDILTRGISGLGAVIAGRRTYDLSIPWWGPNGPSGAARAPVFVVSHGVPSDVPADGVYTFVNGIHDALARATHAAAGKDVSVMGGANVIQQFIRAGLVDEMQIQLVPAILGSGTRLFDNLGASHITLEATQVSEGGKATHLRFRIVR